MPSFMIRQLVNATVKLSAWLCESFGDFPYVARASLYFSKKLADSYGAAYKKQQQQQYLYFVLL